MRTAIERFREAQASSSRTLDGGQAAKMRIRDFAGSGRIVRLYSSVLGCDVLLAADNIDERAVAVDGTLVVYRAREFRHLREVTSEDLRLIHAVKLEFGGELVD